MAVPSFRYPQSISICCFLFSLRRTRAGRNDGKITNTGKPRKKGGDPLLRKAKALERLVLMRSYFQVEDHGLALLDL